MISIIFYSAFSCLVNIDLTWHWRHVSIQRKFHVKKVRFTICNNLYGIHNIIANHTSGPFVLGFRSWTFVVVKVTWVSQLCIVPGFSFWISESCWSNTNGGTFLMYISFHVTKMISIIFGLVFGCYNDPIWIHHVIHSVKQIDQIVHRE